METLILPVLAFGAMCFAFTIMRNAFGAPDKRNAADYVAMVGMWLCPLTWGIFLIILPAALLCDHLDGKEFERRMKKHEHRIKEIQSQ